ncbi:Ig-like domain-containing protein [uncultured Candidatus Pelagibacter sp.]|uniref:Ig-like domain-containing protein n=1 Tax=uncultured Candidatus Pelagibacter sp. TaxID=372654 RepID=UPI00260D96A3|nr:Ig-like domain-containing protein [uncultured Candidatus Pelagibacter sp.]
MKFFIKVSFSIFFICLFSLKAFAGVTYAGNGERLDLSGRNAFPLGIAWNNDGSKLFISGSDGFNHGSDHEDAILEYSCLTDYDVSTCTYVRELPLNNSHSGANGPVNIKRVYALEFNDTGTKLYVGSGANNTGDSNGPNRKIYEITLDDAFNMSGGTLTNTLDVSSEDSIPTDISFNDDGSKLFVNGFQGNTVIVYPLDTDYSLAASSVGTPAEFDLPSQTPKNKDIIFNNDGTKMYISSADSSNDHISVYSVPTAFDLSAGFSHLGDFSVQSQNSQPWGIEFNDVGTKLFMVGFASEQYVYEYSLSTAFDLGFTDPILSSSVPADNATGVAVDANIVLNFSENVDRESGDIEIYKISGELVETISVTSNQVTGTGSKQITVNPSSNFDDLTQYYVLIGPTAFDDVDGRSYAGIPSDTEALSFTTVNTIPTLTSSVPDDDATGVALNSTIVLNFSENVDAESGGTITIKKTTGNATVETISVTSSQVTGSGSSQITITPSSNFEENTEYYILISNSAFDDSDGGSYAGIASLTDRSFTTTNTLPTLTSSVPTDNATNIAVDATIVLNFSENVDAESGGTIIIKKTSDDSQVESINVTDTDRVSGSGSSQITITPSSNFDNNTEYYVLISANAFDDISSDSYAGIPSSKTALSFTTTNAVPTLTSSVPADDATDVERDANIILNFSENVDAETGDIEIYKTLGDVLVETIGVTSSQVTGSGTSEITINPSSNFDSLTEYYVLIDATAFDNSSSGSYAGISSTTALSFTIKAMVDPTTDKDVTGTIDAQNMMAKTTLTEFTSIVNDRLRYLRQNRINKDFTKNNIKLDFGNAMLTSLAETIPASKISLPDLIPKNWSSWSEGFIGMTRIGDSKNSTSKKIDTHGLALGFDTKLNNNDLLGLALQFSQNDSEVGTSGTGIDSKNYNLSIYRTRPLDDDNFVEGFFGFVLTENELVRKSGTNTLKGSRNGTQIFGSINYGKTFDKEDFNLTPIARVDLGYTELDAYTEIGTDALTYGKQTVESGLASIGLEINDFIKFSKSSIKPFGSFQYGLDFSNSSDSKMNYVSDTSTIYTYTPGINSKHLLTVEVGFNYELKDHLKLIGIFKRIQGSESQQINNIRFGYHYISQRETEYAMNLEGSEKIGSEFKISKNVNDFKIDFKLINQDLSKLNNIDEATISFKKIF